MPAQSVAELTESTAARPAARNRRDGMIETLCGQRILCAYVGRRAGNEGELRFPYGLFVSVEYPNVITVAVSRIFSQDAWVCNHSVPA